MIVRDNYAVEDTCSTTVTLLNSPRSCADLFVSLSSVRLDVELPRGALTRINGLSVFSPLSSRTSYFYFLTPVTLKKDRFLHER